MIFFTLPDNRKIADGSAFELNGVAYPGNWLANQSDSDLASAGIVKTVETPVPQVVSMRQARQALLAAGLLASVDAAVSASSAEVQIDWEYATEVRRSSPVIASLQGGLNLSDSDVDQLFITASQL